MKTAFPDIVGNERLRARLADGILSGTLSHAYLIEGAAGTGKHSLALRIAAALSCEKKTVDGSPLPCGTCPACRKILSGNSPDVLYVNKKDKATLGVEAVREMHSSVYVAPIESETKVYIIEEAHLMTLQAQNAFLLTLEEPPAYVLFLLLAESAEPLLETIRSRAPTLRTAPIPPALMEEALCNSHRTAKALREENPVEFRELIAASSGSLGRAATLLDARLRRPILAERDCARRFIRLCGSRHNSAAVLSFLAELGQKREEITAQLNVILLALRDLLLCKQSDNAPLCFFADRDEARNEAYRFSSPELLRLCSGISETVERLRRNANVRLALTEFAVGAGLLS